METPFVKKMEMMPENQKRNGHCRLLLLPVNAPWISLSLSLCLSGPPFASVSLSLSLSLSTKSNPATDKPSLKFNGFITLLNPFSLPPPSFSLSRSLFMATANSLSLKLSFFLLLLLFPSQLTQSQTLNPDTTSSQTPIQKLATEVESQSHLSLIDRQEALIDRLETLISTLEQSIASLKPKPKLESPPSSRNASPKPAISVAKSRPLFTERFLFSAAAKLSSSVPSSATPLPFVDPDSHTKYFAIGDSLGTVYIFSCTGDVVLELPSFSNTSVTALLAYLSPTKRGECLLFVGHADGSVGAHGEFIKTPLYSHWTPTSTGLGSDSRWTDRTRTGLTGAN